MPVPMQPAKTERRAHATRVPLDLFIRLAHEDYEEPFDADGVDISTGGLALRADYLPEVGDRLRCTFEGPPTGEEIAVDGEVVWAHDAGERSGEFGIRFDPVDEHVQESLRSLVRHLRGDAATVARLHLDGVATPIEAEIIEHEARWLTVEQELPFLRIGMGVTLEGAGAAPRGQLASVDLRVVDGTPRLVLAVELAPEEAQEDLQMPVADAWADEDEAAEDEPPREATFDEDEPADDRTMQDYELPEELLDAAPARDEVRIFTVHDEADDAPRDVIEGDDEVAASRLAMLRERVRPWMARLAAVLAAAMAKAGPGLKAFFAKVVALSVALGQKAGPRLAAGLAWSRGALAKVALRKGKRRTTAAPPKRVAGAPRRRQVAAEEEVAPPRKNGRRIVALSVLAFAAVGATVYALAGGDEPAPTAQLPAASAAPAPLPAPIATPAPLPAPAPFPEVAAADPETAEAAEAVAAPAPEPEGGQLGAPSFPSLADADPSSAPVVEGPSFGASSVADGRSTTIRMSQSVTTLRGQPTDSGFTVTVPGALALDRAGPIAAANPSVERAMILNRGDHAVLTVRFVAGRTPPYRVAARGRAIEVIIGR